MAANSQMSNKSIGKGLQIIEVLSQSNAPMRLRDIAQAVEMPDSTVLRMLSTLIEYEYIRQDMETSKYFLTLKFAKIGASVSSHRVFRDISHPILLELSEKCQEAACIAVEGKNHMIYVDVVDGPDGMLKIMHYIGKQVPMHCTGVGKCIMLNYSEAQIDAFIRETGLPRYTPNTITTKDELLRNLERVRKLGYACDDQERELGARCVASYIKDYSGKIIAAISVSGPINRMTYEYFEQVSAAVVKAAKDISAALSYTDN